MDAADAQNKKDNCRHRLTVCAVVFFALSMWQNTSCAQVARLASRAGDQEMAYDYSTRNPPQAFTPVVWNIQNARFREGCVIQWAAEAFTHSGNRNYRADCDLRVAIQGGTRTAGWTVTTPFDSSDLAAGKGTATVEISCTSRGNARASLLVRFAPSPQAALPGGQYQTTLTGTITGI